MQDSPERKARIAAVCEQLQRAADLGGPYAIQLMIRRQVELHGDEIVSAALIEQVYANTR